MLDNCSFIDMGFSGPTFTCTRSELADTKERLDRAWCNPKWRVLAPNATIQHLPRTISDNHPLLMKWDLSRGQIHR